MKLYKLVSVIVLALLGLMPTQGSAATLGDIDGNGEVNVSDVTALVNQILGTAQFDSATCDVNADGSIDVSDVTTLVNIILGTYEDPNQKLAGADISLLDRYEQRGAIYYDKNGTKVTDMLAFYKQIGLNAMRVRLFVDPSKASDADKGQGVFQDIAYVKALGKRIKDHGLKFILDFHYSDSWADPGKQTVPSRWAGLSVEAMADSVYSYTKVSLEAWWLLAHAPTMCRWATKSPTVCFGLLAACGPKAQPIKALGLISQPISTLEHAPCARCCQTRR